MTHLLLVYVHLIATCAAIGMIVATDLRVAGLLLRRATRADARREPLRLAPPAPFVVRLVGVSLVVLLASGIALVALAVQARPDALANPKLQAKIGFVALLVLNAAALHRYTFAGLARLRFDARQPLVRRLRSSAALGFPVAVSQGLWAYCAFLGIARPWNFTVPLEWVVGVGLAVVGLAWVGCTALLCAASAPATVRVKAIPTLEITPDAPRPAAGRA